MTTARPVREKGDFLVFGAPRIEENEIDEVVDSLKAGWLGTGPKVAQFEDEFRAYCGSPYAVAVSSCTAALHLSLIALGIGPGDEVITTPLTFCASVNSIIHVGAQPVLADIDPHTYNVDPATIEAAITPRTKAVMPVHYAGRPCEMDAITEIVRREGLLLIEDCAHAIESEYHGQSAGTFGDAGCYSFYVTKNVTTGEGGMVAAPDEKLAEEVKVQALHGMTKDAWRRFSDDGFKHYQVVKPGFKYNMMDLQAAVGIHQLRRVDENLERRRRVWDVYQRELADLPLTLPQDPAPDTRHAYHLYTPLVTEESQLDRDQVLDAISKEGIGVGVHYLSIPEHPYYQEAYGWRPESTPVATSVGRRTFSLPLSGGLTENDVADVIEATHRVLAG